MNLKGGKQTDEVTALSSLGIAISKKGGRDKQRRRGRKYVPQAKRNTNGAQRNRGPISSNKVGGGAYLSWKKKTGEEVYEGLVKKK